MNVTSYLRDRWLYVAAYALNILLVLLVVQLGLFQEGAVLSLGNVLYLVLLSVVILILIFVLDYGRQRRFYEQMNHLLLKEPDRDPTFLLQNARTREQQAFQDIVSRQYRHYMETLSQYRERQQQHLHFTNQWVHQMKTPVAVIDLVLQQAWETMPRQDAKEMVDSIGEETEKLTRGLEMMLYTARLDAFSFDVKVERVDIVHILREAVNEHKKMCIRESVFPEMLVEKEEVVIQTDVKWMRFVCHQLIANAVKYSRYKPGNKTLRIRVHEADNGWQVSIEDEGVGIPEQDLPRVFDAFFTGDNGRTYPESTGVGLYLVKQVCDRLGHGLSIHSKKGEGTSVALTFRRHRHVHDL